MADVLKSLPKPFFVMAPMDDVTDTVFRQIIAGCAAPDLFITEFVNVDGLQSPGRAKLIPKLQFSAKEKPILAQLWGKVPENYYKTAKELVGMGFDGIDLNFGCPVKAVIKNGCGAMMINNRELVGEISQATREAVGNHFPISVKTRLGLKEVDYSWFEFLLKQKLNMLTIHGRTASGLSKDSADWGAIGKIRELRDKLSPTTLIVGNGDVMTRSQGSKLAAEYSLDGIMIGRSVFSDPYVFSKSSPWLTMSKEEKINLYKKHVQLFAKTWENNERKIHTLNKFCKIYVNGFDGAKELREQLMRSDSVDELLSPLP